MRYRPLGFLFAGLCLGGAIALGAVRLSRNPGSVLHRLRSAAGQAPRDTSELNWLQRTYGEKQSLGPEEWLVRDFFRDKRNGVFVDVGAADPQQASNTWYLETRLGWSGIAVDAQDRYRAGWEQQRPRAKFFTFFVADRSNEKAHLYVTSDRSVASSQQALTANYGKILNEVDVATITLNDLLQVQGVAHVDFLSMDIELAEPLALAGFDIRRFEPGLVCIEAHPQVRQRILDYFHVNLYVVIGKYLRVDAENLWFMPAGTPLDPFPI